MPEMGGGGIQTWTDLHLSSWTLEPVVPYMGPEMRFCSMGRWVAALCLPLGRTLALQDISVEHSLIRSIVQILPLPSIFSTLHTTPIFEKELESFWQTKELPPNITGLRNGHLPWVGHWLQPPGLGGQGVSIAPSFANCPLNCLCSSKPCEPCDSTTAHRILESLVHPFL